MPAPSIPGSYVGQHSNGYFWNGTSWDEGGTVSGTSTSGATAEELFQRQAAASSSTAAPAVSKATAVTVGSNQAAFIAKFRAAAEKVAQETGIPVARILAQAGFETGWNVNPPGNNLFGVKAQSGYGGQSQALATKEADASGNLVPTTQNFRTYDNPEDSFRDWAKVIQQGNFKTALDPNLNDAQYAQTLQAGGYGTDPAYASKLHGVINMTKAALGQSSDGSTVMAGNVPAQPLPGGQPTGGLLQEQIKKMVADQATRSAEQTAAAEAAKQTKEQEAVYAGLTKEGMGLLQQAHAKPAQFMPMEGGNVNLPDPRKAPALPNYVQEATAAPDFMTMLMQQRLQRRT